MKSKILLLAAIALLSAPSTFAQEFVQCQRGTLASYIALGSGGCMFNSALYRDFTYTVATTNAVSANDIIVDPVSAPTTSNEFLGLNFLALTTPWSAGVDTSSVSVIGYNTVPFPPAEGPAVSGVGLTLDLGTATIGGIIGGATVTEQVTTAGVASTTDLEVYDICADGCSQRRTESVTLSPASTLQTTLTISISGGTGGASLSNFAADDVFTL
ncbi:MAG: hypothetical protein ABSF28_06215 [Terracidiphilus sp.]